MKIKFAAVHILTIFLCFHIQVDGFTIRDFFFGGHSSDTTKRSSDPIHTEPNKHTPDQNTTIPADTEIENDLSAGNFSFGGEFVDPFLLNASGNVVPQHSTSEKDTVTTKQSVKKQLLNTPPSFSVSDSARVQEKENDASHSTKSAAVSPDGEWNVTSGTDEIEDVVLGTTAKTPEGPEEKTIIQKSLEWVENTYVLSILIPVAAGVLFATACIVTIAICGCLRRWCRRRRLRRKILPDSVKSLRASDRKRLLGDCSSDEEF